MEFKSLFALVLLLPASIVSGSRVRTIITTLRETQTKTKVLNAVTTVERTISILAAPTAIASAEVTYGISEGYNPQPVVDLGPDVSCVRLQL